VVWESKEDQVTLEPGCKARIASMTEEARPLWETTGSTDELQQYLKDHDCHGVDAVMVTMRLLGCGLADAQRAYLLAPCREMDLQFHNDVMEGLARAVEGEG
jgi:hypothetical protein